VDVDWLVLDPPPPQHMAHSAAVAKLEPAIRS